MLFVEIKKNDRCVCEREKEIKIEREGKKTIILMSRFIKCIYYA